MLQRTGMKLCLFKLCPQAVSNKMPFLVYLVSAILCVANVQSQKSHASRSLFSGSNYFTSSSEHVISTNADGAKSVFAIDVDGDGDMDVLSASYSDDKIAWYEKLPLPTSLPTAQPSKTPAPSPAPTIFVQVGYTETYQTLLIVTIILTSIVCILLIITGCMSTWICHIYSESKNIVSAPGRRESSDKNMKNEQTKVSKKDSALKMKNEQSDIDIEDYRLI